MKSFLVFLVVVVVSQSHIIPRGPLDSALGRRLGSSTETSQDCNVRSKNSAAGGHAAPSHAPQDLAARRPPKAKRCYRYEIVGSSRYPDSAISVARRDVASRVARQRCERCRDLPLCKEKKICGVCDKLCVNVETFPPTPTEAALNPLNNEVPAILPGADSIGSPPSETAGPTVLSSRSAVPEMESSRSIGGRFFAVGEIDSRPTKNLIAKLFDFSDVEKVEKFIIVAKFKQVAKGKQMFGFAGGVPDFSGIVDLINAFGENGTLQEIHPVNATAVNESRRLDLAQELNTKLDKAIKDKKQELNTNKLSREQISAMIESIMAEINEKNKDTTTLQMPESSAKEIEGNQPLENEAQVRGMGDDWVDDNEEARISTPLPLPVDHPDATPENNIEVLGETLNVSGETKPKPESDNQFNIQTRKRIDEPLEDAKQMVLRTGEQSEDLAKDIMKIVEDSFRMPLGAENSRASQSQNNELAQSPNDVSASNNAGDEKVPNQMVAQQPIERNDDQDESMASDEDDSRPQSAEDSNQIPNVRQEELELLAGPQRVNTPTAATEFPPRMSAANQENSVKSFKLPQDPELKISMEKLMARTAEGPIKKPRVIEISKGDDPIKIIKMLRMLREMGKIEDDSEELAPRASKEFPRDTPVLWSDLHLEELFEATSHNVENRMDSLGMTQDNTESPLMQEATNLEIGKEPLGASTPNSENPQARTRVFPYHLAHEFDPEKLPKGPLSPEELAITDDPTTINPGSGSTSTPNLQAPQARTRVFPYHLAREFDPERLPKGPLSPEELAITDEPTTINPGSLGVSTESDAPALEARQVRTRVFPYHLAREFDPERLPKGPLSPEELAITDDPTTINPGSGSTLTPNLQAPQARTRVFPYHLAHEFDPERLPKRPLSPEELAITDDETTTTNPGSLGVSTESNAPTLEARQVRTRVFPYHLAHEFDPEKLPKGPLSPEELAITDDPTTINPESGTELSETVGAKPEKFHSFGSIVPMNEGVVGDNPNSRRVYFIGKDIALPLQVMQDKNGVLQLSVDMDKLCNCKNKNCPKKHDNPTKVEQKIEPGDIFNDSPQSPVFEEFGNDEISNLPKQIFKRSPEIYDNELVKDYKNVVRERFDGETNMKLDHIHEDDAKNLKYLADANKALVEVRKSNETAKKIADLSSNALALMKKLAEQLQFH